MYGIKENKPRYGNLCLPTSVNASVIALKQLSRRVKMEIDRHPFPVKRHILSQTWLDINKVLQRTRQLESDHIANEKYETNVSRKKYQSSLITKSKECNKNITISRKDLPKNINRGITISIGDIWRHKINYNDFEYKVLAITKFYHPKSFDPTLSHEKDSLNTYLISFETSDLIGDCSKSYISIPIYQVAEQLYLHDVAFFDTDYTPDYCENCDTYHNAWANDGGLKLND